MLGPDGQAATALVRIAVREADPDTNNPPVPETVIARVEQGMTRWGMPIPSPAELSGDIAD